MRISQFYRAFIFLFCAAFPAFSIQGSDGPTPFSLIQPPAIYYLPTQTPVLSFTILEKSREMAYVDTDRVLNVYDLESGTQKSLGKFTEKLLPFTDQQEKYLLSGSHRILTEITNQLEEREIHLPLASRFLFWNEENLYLMKKIEKVKKTTWKISFFSLNPERNVVQHKQCEFEVSQPDLDLKLGEGHRFPDLLLYHAKNTSVQSELSIYRLDLRTRSGRCTLRPVSENKETFRGSIQSVTQVSDQDDIVVMTDHPEINLFYGQPNAWESASLPSGVSYIPNPKTNIVVNLNRKRGVGIYSLKSFKFTQLEMPIDQELLTKTHIWVTGRGDTFYMSGKDSGGKRGVRTVYQVDLKSLN